MNLETAHLHNEGNESPYTVEKIENLHLPVIEAQGQRLMVNGAVEEKYDRVGNLKKQTGNPDLVYFEAGIPGNEKEYGGRIIDRNNPKQELLVIKQVYFGGYHVEMDPAGNKIVFAEAGHDNQSVIVNNREWNTKFKNIDLATSKYGSAYAIGENKLVIEDKEWMFPKVTEEQKKTMPNWSGLDRISKATLGKNGEVAAAIATGRDQHFGEYIFVGDKQGARSEWKESFRQVKDMVIDEQSGTVAVFGKKGGTDEVMEIVMNDIPYTLEDSPESLDYFRFDENGALVIEYKNAMAQAITERISLQEGAAELQVLKTNKEQEAQALEALRAMLAQEQIPLEEVMARLKAGQGLESKTQENNVLNESVDKLQTEKKALELKLEELNAAHAKALEAKEKEISDLQVKLASVKETIGNAESAMLGGGYKISKETRNSILNM